MANDIDMWNDIEDLERIGEKEKAERLLEIYNAYFIEGNREKAERLKERFERDFNEDIDYW